jgi:hypothetical protein
MNTIEGSTLIALAIVNHAWVSRIQGPPEVLSIIGVVINVLMFVAIAWLWVR